MTTIPAPSLDDVSSWPFVNEPFFAETLELLRSVRDHDFATLARRCDDDFGIVDLDTNGQPVPIRSRIEWEAWFTTLFEQLTATGASTDSTVTNYDAIRGTDLGYSVLEFRQSLTIGDQTAYFDCIATIVWKLTGIGWQEARWHASLLSTEIPEGFGE
ncbi:MAG: nuclear transport factor 2 family protein [Acidobacteriota bacterium]